MKSIFLCALLLSSAASLSAQDAFIAPTSRTIIGSADFGYSVDRSHTLYVRNESTIPIIVFGVVLRSCENVKGDCFPQRTNIAIPPGARRSVGHVAPRVLGASWKYMWNFSYRADSSDAKVVELLRQHGVTVGGPPPSRDSQSVAQAEVEKPQARAERDSISVPGFRFKVFFGSVLGSTMMPSGPTQLTGPCINPEESAAYEKDPTITKTPWRPPELSQTFGQMLLPIALHDSLRNKDVLLRFVTDTTGESIPGRVNILESPHGTISVRVCQMAIASKAMPARDKAGRSIRAWVQVPVHIGP